MILDKITIYFSIWQSFAAFLRALAGLGGSRPNGADRGDPKKGVDGGRDFIEVDMSFFALRALNV